MSFNRCFSPGIVLAMSMALLGGLGGPLRAQTDAAEAGLQDAAAGRPITAAALRQARNLVTTALLERAVRQVDVKVARAEAARLVDELAPQRIMQLLRSGDAGALFNERLARQAAASSTIQATAAPALGDAESELLFVPLEPCRIIDTRLSGGALPANGSRSFHVAGTNAFLAQGGKGGGCGVPLGATEPLAPAVMVNFVAVGAAGPGHLQAWEYGTPMPNAAILGYANTQPQLNVANGVVVPIAGTSVSDFDLTIFAGVSSTHVVADVTGYFTRFPIETLSNPAQSTIVTAAMTTPVDVGDGGNGACHRLTSCTVTTLPGISGKVVLRFWAHVALDHTNGTHDRILVGGKLGIENPPNCTAISDQVANADFELPDIAPTASDVDATLAHGRTFDQGGNTTRTYSLLSTMIIGANSGDRVESARLTCTFIPN